MTHSLGTDPLGRDILTRIMYGARISFAVAVSTLLLGGVDGAMIGLFSGFMGAKSMASSCVSPMPISPSL